MNAKVIVSLSAVSNPFLNNDNHLNVAKVQELNGQIKDIIKALPTVNEKGKAIKPPKPTATYTIKRKAKIVKFDSAQNNAGNLTYLARRAIPVKETKRLTEKGAVRNVDILTVYDKDVLGKLYPKVKEAMAAIKTHMGRADKTKESVKKEKTVIRDQNAKEFARATAVFRKFLKAAGVDLAKDLVESSGGMGGKAVLFRLDKETVVSIGRSDTSKFKAAQKAAAESGDDDADEKPTKKSKKVEKAGKKSDKKVKKIGLKKKSK